MKSIQEKVDATVKWLREKVEKSHTKGLIVGVSGGIDSAVVAYLIQKAYPKDSMGVILPCKSQQKDKEDALKVVKACGIEHTEIDLGSVHDDLIQRVTKSLKNVDDDYSEDALRLSDANLRARLRMSSIYCLANTMNYLVVGTDNAAELYTGYFTKYGDGGVDILPIAHLTKREVYEWAKYLGIPESVIKRPPSAGLWEGQTDEKEMGTTYDYVDDLIEGKEIPQKDREIIEKLHMRSEHKRNMPDQGPKF